MFTFKGKVRATGEEAPVQVESDGALAPSNTEGTPLASAARTATATSADLDNPGCRGVVVFLNVTVASGVGGLQVRVQAKDPASGAYVNLNALPTAVIATGMTTYLVYPGGAVGNLTQGTNSLLPRTWRLQVVHGDASSYTYSLGYCLVR